MKDRVPRYPGRVKLTRTDGSSELVTLERADEPQVVGDALNKAALLSDATAAKLWNSPSGDETVSDALGKLATEWGRMTKVETLLNLSGFMLPANTWVTYNLSYALNQFEAFYVRYSMNSPITGSTDNMALVFSDTQPAHIYETTFGSIRPIKTVLTNAVVQQPMAGGKTFGFVVYSSSHNGKDCFTIDDRYRAKKVWLYIERSAVSGLNLYVGGIRA